MDPLGPVLPKVWSLTQQPQQSTKHSGNANFRVHWQTPQTELQGIGPCNLFPVFWMCVGISDSPSRLMFFSEDYSSSSIALCVLLHAASDGMSTFEFRTFVSYSRYGQHAVLRKRVPFHQYLCKASTPFNMLCKAVVGQALL